jgi:tetratricopeptide (TPR) repeat protein
MVWLVSEWAGENLFRKSLAASTAGAIVAVIIILTRAQMMFWQNGVTVFAHNVDVTPESIRAQGALGLALEFSGDPGQAAVHYRMAIAIDPRDYAPHYHLAECMRMVGHRQEALAEFQAAVSAGHDTNDDIEDLNLGVALARLGRYQEAVARLDAALLANSHFADAMNSLAWLLATCPDAGVRDGTRAVQLAERACEITGSEQALGISTLAAAYAEAGRFDDAVVAVQKSTVLAQRQGQTGLVKKNQKFLQLYLAHKPCRENDE